MRYLLNYSTSNIIFEYNCKQDECASEITEVYRHAKKSIIKFI